MKNTMRRIALRSVFVMIALPAFAFAQGDKPPEPEECVRAQAAVGKIDLLPDGNIEKPALRALFKALHTTRALFYSEGSPLLQKFAAFEKRFEAHRIDGEKLEADKKRYDEEYAAYKSSKGDEAWWKRIEAWRDRGNAWVAAHNAESKQLAEFATQLDNELQSQLTAWVAQCANFEVTVNSALRRAELDAKIAELKAKIESDRRELDRYRTMLPGFHADVEAMAQEAEDAREAGQMAAIDKAIGLQLDGVIASMDAREMLARAQLRQVKDVLIRNGVRPEDAKRVLKGWFDQPNSVPSIRHTKELIEQLGTLREVASAYDSTTKKQYYEALASCLGIFVKTPLLKLAITNAELYTNLFYTGWSYKEASARVNQYSQLADAELLAIAKISALYQKHLRELVKLEKERQALGQAP